MKIQRKTQGLRRFEDIAPSGMPLKQFGNKTKLNRSAGYITMVCPICGISFDRKASEAARHETSYCGRGCMGYAQRRQVWRECRVCGKSYTVKQSLVDVVTCCSPECRLKAISASTSEMDKRGWRSGMFKRGQASPAAKLTDKEVDMIRSDTRTHRIIAEQYGVTRSNISRIKRSA